MYLIMSRPALGPTLLPIYGYAVFPGGKDPVPIVQEAGWAPGPASTCAKNLFPTGIRSPDRPVRNQSLYRLSYPAHATPSSAEVKDRVVPYLYSLSGPLWSVLR
jgi:hypothetical protein